jgi:hypothetical protein
MIRAFNSGVRMVSTERLTVFKFNACARRDSYLRRDVRDQAAMLARLQADPERCVEQEWAGLLRAWREHRLNTIELPAEWPAPGALHRANLLARAVDQPESKKLLGRRRFTLDDQVSAMDWHPAERSRLWGSYRWSGPAPAATVVLPVEANGSFRLRLRVLNWFKVDLKAEVGLFVAGRPVEFTVERHWGPAAVLRADIEGPRPAPLRVGIQPARMRCPHLEGSSADTRWLGVCVNWVEVGPLPSKRSVREGLLRFLPGVRRREDLPRPS